MREEAIPDIGLYIAVDTVRVKSVVEDKGAKLSSSLL